MYILRVLISTMTVLLYFFLYAGGLVFLAGCLIRAIRYARLPIHLRWELYPLPHGRAGQLKVMLLEILFSKALWKSNRSLWLVSFPFHLGLYLVALAAAFLLLSPFVPGSLENVLHKAYPTTGAAGLVLVLLGSLGLLLRRLRDNDLKPYTTRSEERRVGKE